MSKHVDLGSEVEDRITHFKGIATARCEYIDGSVEICVTPQNTDHGKYPKAEYINEHRLEIVGEGVKALPVEKHLGFAWPGEKKGGG